MIPQEELAEYRKDYFRKEARKVASKKFYAKLTPEQKRARQALNSEYRRDKTRPEMMKRRAEKAKLRRAQRTNVDACQFYMLNNAKVRAKKKGVPFSLTLADIVIPKHCPVLGIPLEIARNGKHNDNSPSLDRIIPSLGYISGNVMVISFRANTIKNDATLSEMRRMVEFYSDKLPE